MKKVKTAVVEDLANRASSDYNRDYISFTLDYSTADTDTVTATECMLFVSASKYEALKIGYAKAKCILERLGVTEEDIERMVIE
jgi:hypothetical protein